MRSLGQDGREEPGNGWAKAKGLVGDEEEYVSRLGTATDLVVNLTAMPSDELVALKLRAEREILTSYLKRHPVKGGLEAVRRLVETHGLWGAVKRVGKTVAGK